MTLKTYLLITGIGAFVALAFPPLVIIGYFMLLVPGVILSAMPTAFLYGVVFAVSRYLLAAVLSGMALNVAAVVVTALVMLAIPQPVALATKARLAALRQEKVLPPAPIPLAGHILLRRGWEHNCDALCVALLKTPGVLAVTLESSIRKPATYRLVDAAAPGESIKPTGFGLSPGGRGKADDPFAGARALEAEWNLMLSDRGLKLVAEPARVMPDMAIHITDGPVSRDSLANQRRSKWSLRAAPARRKALEIFDRQGRALLRQELLSAYVPSAPLSISGNGGIENFRFEWNKQRLGDGKESDVIPVDALLLEHTTIARGVDQAAATERTRAGIAAALADPARPAGDAAFNLANQWMESLRAAKDPLSAEDRGLLVRILEDRRVTRADGLSAAVKRLADPAEDLRRLAVQRYLDAPDPKEARYWLAPWDALPPGAFAASLPEEREVLAAPQTAMYAGGLIRRQADRGVEAVPDLLRLLRAFSAYDPGKYGYSDLTSAMEAVRDALRAIGPAAAPARAEIETLLATPGLARRYENNRQSWDVLLVVLGRPVDTLEKPANLSGTVERYRERVASAAAKPYRPGRD
jgi:hypothetical protein